MYKKATTGKGNQTKNIGLWGECQKNVAAREKLRYFPLAGNSEAPKFSDFKILRKLTENKNINSKQQGVTMKKVPRSPENCQWFAEHGNLNTWSQDYEALKALNDASIANGGKKTEIFGYDALPKAIAHANNVDIYMGVALLDLSYGILPVYTDGSYDAETNRYSWGIVIILGKDNFRFLWGCGDNKKFVGSRNVAGEIFGAINAFNWAIQKGYKKVHIISDFEGIGGWGTGRWQANCKVAQYYVKTLRKRITKDLVVYYQKVLGHYDIRYNDWADQLARSAFSRDSRQQGQAKGL